MTSQPMTNDVRQVDRDAAGGAQRLSGYPTDEEIMAAIEAWGSDAMTYVIRNRLSTKKRPVDIARLRRRLTRLEREGKVHRVSSVYATQICWKVGPTT